MAGIPPASLEFIVNHVALPPKLPQKAEDPDASRAGSCQLIDLLVATIQSYRQQCTDLPGLDSSWAIVETALIRYGQLLSTPSLSVKDLSNYMLSLRAAGRLSRLERCHQTDARFLDILPVQIRAQNATIILRKTDRAVTIECFESSPTASSVMAAKGSLIRYFPAHAISIPIEVFSDHGFQYELAHRLTQLDTEIIEEMLPRSQKARSWTGEVRDTAYPGLVTEMLMATLAPFGEPVQVRQICKRTRDDVLWQDCLYPWRRSPEWLTVKVTMQTTLEALLPNYGSAIEYKTLMILFLTEIASYALAADLPGDLCHVIIAKIARRAHKAGPNLNEFVQQNASKVCQAIRGKQEEAWRNVQTVDGDRPTTLEKRAFENDTFLSLDACKAHLSRIIEQNHDDFATHSEFKPNCSAWYSWERGLPVINELESFTKDELFYGLADFEAWISKSLPSWRVHRLASSSIIESTPSDCMALANLATKYRDLALKVYNENPEQVSIMYLVIAELWHTLDLLVVKVTPLLCDFPPHIPPDLFSPLLLPKRKQMERLMHVETHITSRLFHAKSNNLSVFSDPQDDSFATQFYASSAYHQTLRKRIEDEACEERSAKEEEWRELLDKYHDLIQKGKGKSCSYIMDNNGDNVHIAVRCEKCRLEDEAKSIVIAVHEWPLPERENACQSAVFELDCPVGMVSWRHLTWLIVNDLGRETAGKAATAYAAARLPTYAGLKKYYKKRNSRLTLASSARPFLQSHYGKLNFPVSLDQCLVKNALRYQLFDSKENSWVRQRSSIPTLHANCCTHLPLGPYSNMQYTVDSVNHSQNQVIADQTLCSSTLSLHEFLSFGSLRSDGERVQWYNIRRELAATNLNFNDEAVCILITQAAWQVGSTTGSSMLRNSHADLGNPAFCKELLSTTSKLLDSIRANWKSDHTMQVLTVVTLRVFSLCNDQEVAEVAHSLLQDLRTTIYEWTNVLASILHEAEDPQHISKLQARLVKTALLGKMTFDVDEHSIRRVLATDLDLSVWVTCSMYVRNNFSGHIASLPQDLCKLVLRDMKTTLAVRPAALRLVLEESSPGFDVAIAQIWSAFTPGPEHWINLEAPNDRWLRTETASSDGRPSQVVHYNFLDGELLVDGKPLGRLPKEYISSEIYLRVLGAQILQVFAADMHDMLYMSARKIQDYVLYFGKRGQDIVIRVRNESHILEVVPHYLLFQDFPSHLIDDYVHLMDLSTHEIEFRPLSHIWESNPTNWRLLYSPHLGSRLVCGSRKLVDVRSSVVQAVMNVFEPLETIQNVHVSLRDDDRLEVALPRYGMNFFLNDDGYFECYELCRIVGPDQSVGTLIGLRNRLVLCGILPFARKHDRIVVVPEGKVSMVQNLSHTEVSIALHGAKIRLFRYRVDATLRRLQDNGDVQGTIYKAFLHAVTSHYSLPDPLTERTGTEEALQYLRRRSLNFIKPPEESVVRLLVSLSKLTPYRKYYPQHLKIMQQVEWHSTLSMLVQHDDYLPLAQRIMASGNLYVVFYPSLQQTPSLYEGRQEDLHDRAKIRNACYRRALFSGDLRADIHDHHYEARDSSGSLERASRSFSVVSLIRAWPDKLQTSPAIAGDLSLLGTVSGFGTQFDTAKPLSELPEVKFASEWAPLHTLCRQSSQVSDTYRLSFLFSCIAYGRGIISLRILQTLLAFVFLPKLQRLAVPANYSSCTLSKGIDLNEDDLRNAIETHIRRYSGPGRRMSAQLRRVALETYQSELEEQIKSVLRHYKDQWPCATPVAPSTSAASHLGSLASTAVSKLFCTWTANEKYEEYFQQIQAILGENSNDPAHFVYSSDYWHRRKSAPEDPGLRRSPPLLHELMSEPAPSIMEDPIPLGMQRPIRATRRNKKLRTLIENIHVSERDDRRQSIRAKYRDDLLASYDAFNSHSEQVNPTHLPCSMDDVILYHTECETYMSDILEKIRESLGSTRDPVSKLLELSGFCPQITLREMLALLSTTAGSITKSWRDYLLCLGEAITSLQRSRRLLLAAE